MDNSSEVSTVEPNNEPSTSPNLGIEWGAMALGFLVGLVWFFSQQAVVISLSRYIRPFASTPWFDTVWTLFSVILSFAYGLVIGFVVGYRARHHHYRFTITVILLLFIGTFFYSLVISRMLNVPWFFSFFHILLMLVSLILNIAGSLNGAYLAQSVKRNRGVRIQ